jgi:hypothetical protein
MFAGAMGDLPDGNRRAANHVGNLVIRSIEDFAQHEDGALCRPERFQYSEQRDRNALSESGIPREFGSRKERL